MPSKDALVQIYKDKKIEVNQKVADKKQEFKDKTQEFKDKTQEFQDKFMKKEWLQLFNLNFVDWLKCAMLNTCCMANKRLNLITD